ncbi:MAG: hypothetical protein ACR2L3_03465 [Actinomycetota bacterium]
MELGVAPTLDTGATMTAEVSTSAADLRQLFQLRTGARRWQMGLDGIHAGIRVRCPLRYMIVGLLVFGLLYVVVLGATQ